MKINCDKKELVHALQIVMKSISNRPSMPILSGIFLYAHDNILEILGSDYDLSIMCKINAYIDEEGIVVIPAKYFYDVVRTMPGQFVEIKHTKDDTTVLLSSNAAQFNLLSMNSDEYPRIEHLQGTVNFDIANTVLVDSIKRTSFACGHEDTRPVFTGCLLNIRPDGLIMAATNLHRLAMSTKNIDITTNEELNIVIPAKVLNELVNICSSDVPTNIHITYANNKIAFSYENIYIISRLIEGSFPDYNRVIPKSYKTKVRINKAEFQAALDRVSLISRGNQYNIIRFEFIDGTLRMFSDNPNIGKAEETINIDIDGENISISFNSNYISDVLKTFSGEEFTFAFNQPLSTAGIYQEGKDDYKYVVTPVLTQGV